MFCRVALSLMMLLPVPALADMPLSYTENGQRLFSFSIPDFWTARAGGPRLLQDSPDDDPRAVARLIGLSPSEEEGVWIGFIAPPGLRDFQDGRAYLTDIGPFLVNDPQLERRDTIRVGARAAERFRGTGQRDGRSVSFTALVIDLPGPRVAVSVAVMDSRARPELVEDINAIYNSFRAGGAG